MANKEKGMKEQIKAGELDPRDALDKLETSGQTASNRFIKWCRNEGRIRYRRALKERADGIN